MKEYIRKSRIGNLIYFLVRIRVCGSSTVELSLIMPMLLTLFVFLIYLSFFLYNRVETTANAYICALRGSRMEQETAEETYQKMKEESSALMKGSLLSVSEYKEQIKVKGNSIQVTYGISQQVPGSAIPYNLFYKDTWNFQITKKTKKLQPVFFIRNCRKLYNLNKKQGKDEKDEGDI
ncbi:MAG: pilus assembly protein [Lachnospiraceae bacterium]|nr:pilus assembly protein [Lachnospiraceae bacterium]